MNLYNIIDKACKGKADICTLNLGQLVTDVEWDRVAFVRMQAWAKDPGAAIGVDDLNIDEFEDLIVFAKDRQAVYVLKRDYDPEVPYDHTVFLDFGVDKLHWQVFAKDEAIFKAMRIADGELHNIDLVPIRKQ